MRLQGKVAIVTGTSRNIGGTIAAGFAAEGAAVACNDRRAELAEECAAGIRAGGGQAVAIPGDVTDAAFVDAAVASVVERYGHVDVLVNNAVLFDRQGLLTADFETYRRQLDVILGGAFLFTRAVAKSMIDLGVGGSVINVLSTAAWQGEPGNLGYGTGKSGLINFTRSVAMELAEHDIRVNALTPTATLPDDPRLRAELAGALAGTVGRYAMDFGPQIPLGRLLSPTDYVPAFVFLASDDSKMMTGTNITVDGGATAKYWAWRPTPAAAADG